MTETQIRLVQQSFEQVRPIADTAADMFYTRLLDVNPSLRLMFRTGRREQGRKLMSMLAVAVSGLSRLDQILPAVEELGRRHAQYGVRDEHYAPVAEALLWTLEKGLAEAFTHDVRTAWEAAYTLLASAMQRGAASQQPASVAA